MKENAKKTILSGSTPSGNLTLGNYIGAIANWKAMQEQNRCFFMVADLHALTNRNDPKTLADQTLSFYAQYLACGLDPEKSTLFVQSDVSAHAELAWILLCQTPLGQLNRMTQFKEKTQQNPQSILAGLLCYPALMAADILLYQTELVPVGADQTQHLELTRDLVQAYHHHYKTSTFQVPEAYHSSQGARIMGLQTPDKKMSKSDDNLNNTVFITDSPKNILKKFKSAVTDSGDKIRYNPKEKAGISNLLTIYSTLSGRKMAELEASFSGKLYGHLKVELGEYVVEFLKPVQEKYQKLLAHPDFLQNLMLQHAEKAREIAEKTLEKVKSDIGLKLSRKPNLKA